MCGRFTFYHDGATIRIKFSISREYEQHMKARWNIAPGTEVVAVKVGQPRVAALLRWGLVPSWAKDPKIGFKMINARGETAHEKPSFRSAFKKRRCVIPASGWYEWRKNADGSKTPIYFHRTDGGIIVLAGLWESWTPPEGKAVETCTIITTAAAPRFMEIHDRMPVVLSSFDAWLDEAIDVDGARRILEAPDVSGIETYTVSPLVNRPANDSPECIRPS